MMKTWQWWALLSGALWVVSVLFLMPGDWRSKFEINKQLCGASKTEPDLIIGACTWLLYSDRLSEMGHAISFTNRGNGFARKGQYDQAIQDYDEALRLKPDYTLAYANRGYAYLIKDQYDRAIQDYDEALRLQPDYAKAYYNRGNAYQYKEQYDQAIRDYDKAIRLQPDYAMAYNGKAWLLATASSAWVHDGRRAVTLAQQAVRLHNHSGYIDTLAAAYARAERFEAAVDAQERAIVKLQAEGGSEEAVADFQSRLSLYRRGQAY